MTKHRRQEEDVQRAVFAHLAARRCPGTFAFHVPNGGARSPAEAAILKGLGVVAGVPDIVAICNGRVFGLELKADQGRLSAAQTATHEAMRAAGATVATCLGLDEALARLEAWGLLRGITQSGSAP